MTRFSQIYLERGKPSNDGVRMRRRLYKLFDDLCPTNDRHMMNDIIHRELGQDIAQCCTMNYYYPFDEFFENCELRDLLDMPSMIAKYIKAKAVKNGFGGKKEIEKLLVVTNRIFREENVFYQIDDNGVVHLSPDEELEKNRSSTLKSLEDPRYKAVLNHFEQAHKSLLKPQYDYAIRDIFYAAESLVKLMTDYDKLNEKLCRDLLTKNANKAISSNKHSEKMVVSIMKGYAEQMEGYHEFSHAQPTDNNASIELAVFAVSNFSSFIRFLVEVDQKLIATSEISPQKV